MIYISDINDDGKIGKVFYMHNGINDIDYLGWNRTEKEKVGVFVEEPEDFSVDRYLYVNNKLIIRELSIEEVASNKIIELSDKCTQTIYNGIDVKLADNVIEHFTLDEQDQLNLSGIGLKLLMGAETVAWHEDDESKPCRFYSATDAQKIITSLTVFKEYHITYFRDLRIYIRSLTSAADINNITYGFEIPEEFKSDVLKQYEKLISTNS